MLDSEKRLKSSEKSSAICIFVTEYGTKWIFRSLEGHVQCPTFISTTGSLKISVSLDVESLISLLYSTFSSNFRVRNYQWTVLRVIKQQTVQQMPTKLIAHDLTTMLETGSVNLDGTSSKNTSDICKR